MQSSLELVGCALVPCCLVSCSWNCAIKCKGVCLMHYTFFALFCSLSPFSHVACHSLSLSSNCMQRNYMNWKDLGRDWLFVLHFTLFVQQIHKLSVPWLWLIDAYFVCSKFTSLKREDIMLERGRKSLWRCSLYGGPLLNYRVYWPYLLAQAKICQANTLTKTCFLR